jgi:FtsP/CotA-like multicopper oxidase with cupredoxin domain
LSKNVLTGTGAGQVKDRPLGIVEVSGVAESTSREVTHFASSGDLRNASIDAKRTISFSQSKDAKKYYIDGRLYDHERIDLRVPLGNIEEWTIRNESDEFHEFHIHQVNFQVTQIDGKPQDYAGRADIVRVPERGSVTIRMSFTDPRIIGRFVFHCHVLRHEDLGMMANIEVYDPAAENAPFAGVRRFLHRVQLWRSGVPWKYCHR